MKKTCLQTVRHARGDPPLIDLENLRVPRRAQSRSDDLVSIGFDFLGYRIEPGRLQPSLKARTKVLAAVDEQLRIGRRGINDCIRETDSLANRQRYVQTQDMIDKVIKGWGGYSSSSASMSDIDPQIDAKLTAFRQWSRAGSKH
jgi:hypothetical protein